MATKSSSQSTTEQTLKQTRFRSQAYVSYSIEDSIEFTKTIHSKFGNTNYTSKESLAKVLDVSESSLIQKLSTANQYGLLEMKSKEGYKPTPLFTRIYKPLPDEKKELALIECLKSPQITSKILLDYNGTKFPEEDALSTIIYRGGGISEDAAKTVARVFVRNLKFVGLLNEENILNVESPQIGEESNPNNGSDNSDALSNPSSSSLINQNKNNANQLKTMAIPFRISAGKTAQLIISENFDDSDLDKIVKQLGGYRVS